MLAVGCVLFLGGCLLVVDRYTQNSLWFDMGRVLGKCVAWDTRARTACYEDTIASLYPKHDVTDIFSAMALIQKVEPGMIDCHFIAHRLGEVVTYADPDSWPNRIIGEKDDSLCAFGYVHGVTIAAFKDGPLSAAALETELPKFKKACVGADITLQQKGNCNHGIGHMLYYVVGKDVPKGLELCDAVVPGDFKRNDMGRKRCYAGVLMGVFQGFIRIEDEEVNPFNLSKETSRPFCEALEKDAYVGACLRQSWPLFSNEIIEQNGIEKFCANQPNQEETEWCFAKVFKGVTWYLINELDRVRSICTSVSPPWQKVCFTNAAQEIIEEGAGTEASVARAVAFCGQEDARSSRECVEQLLRRAGYFSDQGSSARSAYCAQLPAELHQECMGKMGER